MSELKLAFTAVSNGRHCQQRRLPVERTGRFVVRVGGSAMRSRTGNTARVVLVAAGLVVMAGGSASAINRMVTEFPISTAGSHPRDMTVGPDGNTWFVEHKSGKIGEVTRNGTITEFAVPTKLSSPTTIA